MEIKWINVNEGLPEIGEDVLTCDKEFPEDGFEWEHIESDGDWSKSYAVSHWARLNIKDI